MAFGAADFVNPEALFLLILLVPLFWLVRRGQRARGVRATLSLLLRLLVMACLVTALARPRLVNEVHQLAVAFVLDVSESVPFAARDRALRKIEQRFDEIKDGDQASLVIFGERPSVEVPFRGTRDPASDAGFAARLDNLESRINLVHTDIGRAVEFTEGTFPSHAAKRIVLISDGNETRGDLAASARALKSQGARLDVLPLSYRYKEEVIVEGLHTSGRGRVGEPLQLRAVVSSLVPTNAELLITRNGEPLGDTQAVRLDAGTNVFRFSETPPESGYFQYEVRVRASRDGNQANNVGRTSVLVGGQPRVIIASQPEYDERIGDALEQAGISVSRQIPRQLPRHPAGYFDVDSVVLNNVPAFQMDEAQQDALHDAVKELGVGLVTIGGPESFGPGGYRGTPIEKLLPVDLETKNKKSMPKGALVIVLHSIEFDSGNTWAVKICKSALKGLSADDEAGIVYYDSSEAEKWLFDLAPLGDKKRQYSLIERVFVGDMPSFHNCFVLAEKSLAASNAAVKHIIVISDGDPQTPDDPLLQRLTSNRITISTICIDPHSPTSVPTMRRLARRGHGRYYRLDPRNGDLQKLPKVMLKEAATLRRAAISEKPFTPVGVLASSPILRGLGNEWPQLGGYVVTSMRGGAETILLANEKESDPLLAAWHVGLGRSIAFTSDASSRWAKDWLAWGKFGPFWTQLVRSSSLEGEDTSPYPVGADVKGSRLEVTMDATADDGTPLTDLNMTGTLLGEGRATKTFKLQQTEAGRYAAKLEGLDQGHYLVRVEYQHEGKPTRSMTVAAVDFAPEYRSLSSNERVLTTAAALADGRVLDWDTDPFVHDFAGVTGLSEFWPWFVVAAALLLLMEIVTRRLDVNPMGPLSAWLKSRRRSPLVTASSIAPVETKATDRDPGYKPQRMETPAKPKGVPDENTPPESPEPDKTMEALKKAKRRAEKRREWQ